MGLYQLKQRDVIPVMRPKLPPVERIVPYLEKVYGSGIFSNGGPLLVDLEARYAELLGVDPSKVVMCASATVALEWSISTYNHTQLLVPAFTFAATGLAAMNSRRDIVWCDADLSTGFLSPQSERISSPSLLPVAVVPFGERVTSQFFSLAREGILDAAASLGNSAGSLTNLPLGWTVVFSVHATKALGVGEGGIAVFGDESRAAEFRSRINFGYLGGEIAQYPGTNGKVSEFVAAVGHAVLDDLDVELEEWKSAHKLANRYYTETGLTRFSTEAPFQPYEVVLFESKSQKARAVRILERSGIGYRSWWPKSIHRMPALESKGVSTPNSDNLADTTLGLPMFRNLDSKNVELVVQALAESLLV